MKSLFSILDCVNFENQRFRKMSEKKKLSELVNAQIQKIEFWKLNENMFLNRT